nr:unnamed protein product [Callosobruchus analis]
MKLDEEKINILMYVLREEAEEVMLQFNPQQITFSQTLNAFENHFIPRRNIIFERYKFNTRSQQQGEPIERFITSLHSLAEHCQYGQLKEELIRDRIVVGMQDRRTTSAFWKPNRPNSKQLRAEQSFSSANGGKGANPQKKCQFYGLVFHPREQCPANKSTCRSCKKQGHWAVVCRSNKVRSIEAENLYDTSNTTNDSCLNCNSYTNLSQDNQFLGSIQLNHI